MLDQLCVTVVSAGRGRFNRGTGKSKGERCSDSVIRTREVDIENMMVLVQTMEGQV